MADIASTPKKSDNEGEHEVKDVAVKTHSYSVLVNPTDRHKVAHLLSWMLQINSHPLIHRIEKTRLSSTGKLTIQFQPATCSLQDIIDETQKASSIGSLETVGWQLCNGLAYLHKCGLVHTHLTPDLLFWVSDRIQIGGLYYALPQTTTELSYVSQRNYRAPEILVAAALSRPWTVDIWAVGCILLEFLTHKPLFSLVSSKSDDDMEPQGKRLKQQLSDIIDAVGTPQSDEDCDGYRERHKVVLLSQPKQQSRIADIVRASFSAIGETNTRRIEGWSFFLSSCLSFGPQRRPTAQSLCESSVFAGLPPMPDIAAVPFDARSVDDTIRSLDDPITETLIRHRSKDYSTDDS